MIALTANAVVGAEGQYLSAGFDGYLSKPITIQELEKTLRKYLPQGSVEDRAQDAEEEKPASVSLDKVRSLGLNVDAGLMYTCSDEDFYLELLTDYARSADDKCSELSSYLEKGDLKNYEDRAKALEEASRDQNTDFVNANHEAFVTGFRELASKILG